MYISIRFPKKVILAIIAILVFSICFAVPSYFGVQSPASAESSGEYIDLPIIMYHGVIKEKKLQGKYVISPETFENDLKYLKENGYTTIVIKDLIDFAYEGKPLPEKPIMITFDDGYYNNYLYAFPLLKEYNSKMVFSPIGRYADAYSETVDTHANYAHASWDNINEMIGSGLVEVQNHSYNMHTTKGRNGTKKKKGESLDEYKKLFSEDVMKMQKTIKKNTGIEATTFTYPFGAISNVSVDILKELGFKATLTCEAKMNKLYQDPKCLYGLNRFLRPNNVSTKAYFEKTVKLDMEK